MCASYASDKLLWAIIEGSYDVALQLSGMSTFAQLNSCLVFNPFLKGKWVYYRFPSGECDSPYWKIPRSLAVYSSWSFTHWQNNLKRAGYCLEYFVDQELEAEDNPLTTAGWRAETLLALFK